MNNLCIKLNCNHLIFEMALLHPQEEPGAAAQVVHRSATLNHTRSDGITFFVVFLTFAKAIYSVTTVVRDYFLLILNFMLHCSSNE